MKLSKQVKKTCENLTHFNDCASPKFVATILVKYNKTVVVSILTKPDLSLQN